VSNSICKMKTDAQLMQEQLEGDILTLRSCVHFKSFGTRWHKLELKKHLNKRLKIKFTRKNFDKYYNRLEGCCTICVHYIGELPKP